MVTCWSIIQILYSRSYKKLLECSTVGKMKQHLAHYLNKKKKCSVNIPLLTCVAIQLGKLLWANVHHPVPFKPVGNVPSGCSRADIDAYHAGH